MRLIALALVSSALVLPAAANATVTAGLGGNTSNFLSLSSAGLNGGSVATLQGGTIYNSDQPFADIPKGGVFQNSFLAAGTLAGQPATLTFTAPVNYLSFLWGSPDTYNLLTLTTNTNSYSYTAQSLGFTNVSGDQTVSQYVQFAASAGELITGVSFTNAPENNAFEVANFSTTAVPEPASWAMLIVGFGMVGGAMRSRKKVSVTYA